MATAALIAAAVVVVGCASGSDAFEEPIVAMETGCHLARGTLEEAAARPSPLDSAMVAIDGAGAKVCYGSPRANGREVMGQLVPFEQLWRTGANEATAIHLDFPAEIAGVPVGPGSYSIYTRPTAEAWTVFVNGSVERWGIPITDEVRAADVGEGTVTTEAIEEPLEEMAFRFERVARDRADLLLEWEQTRVRIPVVRTN